MLGLTGQNNLAILAKMTVAAELEAETVGHRVRRMRLERGLSLKDLAEQSGIDFSGLARRERGERTWTETDLQAVAKALGVPVAELFGE